MRPARQHGDELALGIEVREEAAEVTLVSAVTVHEQQDALGVAPLHHVRHQRHESSPPESFRTLRTSQNM